MKKYLVAMLIILILGAIVCGAGYAVYKRSDNQLFSKTIEYTEQAYECEDDGIGQIQLNLQGRHNLRIQEGEKFSVTYSVSEFNSVDVKAENGTLIVNEQSKLTSAKSMLFYKFEATDVVVSVPAGENPDFNISCAGILNIEQESIRANSLDLTVQGIARIKTCLAGSLKANLKLQGISDVELGAAVADMNIDVSGVSKIACDFIGLNLTFNGEGVVTFNGNLICGELSFNNEGTGKVNVSGKCDKAIYNCNGLLDIEAEEFGARISEFNVNGKVDACIKCSESIRISGNGNFDIEYYDSATIDHSFNGNLKIKKID